MLATMTRSRSICALGAAVFVAALAIAGRAEPDGVVLRPRFQAGDRYALMLSVDTKTRVNARESFREQVELRYAAQVEVLATDAAGIPVRERHAQAQLTSVRSDGTRELFAKDTQFELERRADGSVAIEFREKRVEPRVEKIVGDLLAHQAEYALAALLDPGRPAAAGERWPIDAKRAAAFLSARGMSDVELDGAGSAALEEDGVTLRYQIPIRAFALADLPEGSRSTRSKGRLEGEVKLDPRGPHRPRTRTEELVLDVAGTIAAAPGAPAAKWRLRRYQEVEQQTETLKDQLAGS
jgi:hypothetical protein